MPSQRVLQKKVSEVEDITKLIRKYKVIGLADLQKVRAPQLQKFKKNLEDKVRMQVIKNTLMKRAVKNCKERAELDNLNEYLEGSNIFLFSDMDPFKLTLHLQRNKVKITAKSGDVAAFDVTVPAGNTAQPPGPIIGQLNAVGLSTRIESGSVWINKDTLVAKKGEVISERLAAVLSKLGIKPVEAGLIIKVAYDDGWIISKEQLQIDLDKTEASIQNAHSNAFALSITMAYPTTENVEMLVQLAHQQAYYLAMDTAMPTSETVGELFRRAHVEMLTISRKISS